MWLSIQREGKWGEDEFEEFVGFGDIVEVWVFFLGVVKGNYKVF